MKYADALEWVLIDGSSREVGGYDDFVDLSRVASFVLQSRDWAGGDLIDESLPVVQELLASERMTAGDLLKSGFVPWPLDPQDSLRRIEHDWRARGPDLYPGDVCWLANTPKGNAFVAARRGRHS